MNVYLVVEIKYREFLSRLLIGAKSALKGNDVFIGDDELIKLIVNKKLNPGIMLYKSITPIKRRLNQLKNCKKNNCIISSLDEEGGIVQEDFKNFAQRRYSNKSLSYTDTVFCWGKFDYSNYKKIFPKIKRKFLMTGNPRFDLLDNKIAYNFIKRRTSKKVRVAIISSYMVFARSLLLSDQFTIDKKFKDDYYYDHFAFRAGMTSKYLKLLKKIITEFPKLEIDIWIHPNESIVNWKKILPNRKNIRFTTGTKFLAKEKNDNTIFIHSGSGLAFNALLQEKIVISYQPIESKWNKTLPNKNSLIMKSDDEIVDFIKKKKYMKFKIDKKKITECFKIISNSKSYDASDKIALHWEKFKSEKLSKKNNLSKLIIRNQLRFLKQKLNYRVYKRSKFSPFTKSEISNLKNILVKINPKFNNLKFSLIGPRLINIKKITTNSTQARI
tara:strand:- start:9743 stop:11068 length:1326 start_codon:yes stop_codon:yes gene_type:complete